MALTNSQESVARKSRKELLIPEWSDSIVLDQLTKLLAKAGDGKIFYGNDQTVVDVALERFAWLSAQVELIGLGQEARLIDPISGDVNPEWISDRVRMFNVDVVTAGSQAIYGINQEIRRLEQQRDKLNRIIEIKHYIPAADEPSVFSNVRGEPSTNWLLWYSQKEGVGIVNGYPVGKALIEQLEEELPRPVPNDQEPEMVITSSEWKSAGIDRPMLSLAWVIYAKYARRLYWYETHADGLIMIRDKRKS